MSRGTRTSGRIDTLDYLRLAAALSVVAFHYLFNGIKNGKIEGIGFSPAADVAQYGYLGVELFFLISGLVIMSSARGKTARQFAAGRAVRLLPAFWVAMLLTAAVTVWLGSSSGLTVTASQVAGNVTMTPTLFTVSPVDGVYWTLLYEVQFYALIWLLIALGLGRRLADALAIWSFAMLAVVLFAPALTSQSWCVPTGCGVSMFDPYFALFVSGALLEELRAKGIRPLPLLGFVTSAVVALPFVGFRAVGAVPSPATALVVVSVFYVVIAGLCLPRVRAWRLPAAGWVGGLTYPIYLLHAHVGYMLLTWVALDMPGWVAYLVAVGAVTVTALAVHVFVERRMRAHWFALFDAVTAAPLTLARVLRGGERQPVEV